MVAIPGTNDVMRFDVQMHFVQGTTAATVERSKAERVAGAAKGAEADGVGGEAEDAVRDATFDPAAGRGRLAAYEGTLAPAVRTVLRASRAKDDSDGNPFASLPEACVAAILRELANLPEYAPRVHCVLHWRWGGGYGAGRSRCLVLGAFSGANAAEAFVDTLSLQCSAEGGRARDWRPADARRSRQAAERATRDASVSNYGLRGDPDAHYRNFWRWAVSVSAGYMRRTDHFAILPVPVGRVRRPHIGSPHVGANPYDILPML